MMVTEYIGDEERRGIVRDVEILIYRLERDDLPTADVLLHTFKSALKILRNQPTFYPAGYQTPVVGGGYYPLAYGPNPPFPIAVEAPYRLPMNENRLDYGKSELVTIRPGETVKLQNQPQEIFKPLVLKVKNGDGTPVQTDGLFVPKFLIGVCYQIPMDGAPLGALTKHPGELNLDVVKISQLAQIEIRNDRKEAVSLECCLEGITIR